MRNDGFTLVELLAVITIITILTVVAVPSALTFQKNMNKKMFCTKIETVETAAKIYGNDVKDSIEKGILKDEDRNLRCPSSFPYTECLKISVKLLLDKNLLKKEVNNTKLPDAEGNYVYDEFYDPRTYTSMVKNTVIVYIDKNRIYSRFVYESKADLELCNPADATDPNKDLYYNNGGTVTKYVR